MAMKRTSVCALEPEKITKTKWSQYYGTPCTDVCSKDQSLKAIYIYLQHIQAFMEGNRM